MKGDVDYQLEVWKRLWQSRDFELSHLWQRSIFLTAFIVLIYTGYGALQVFALGKILDSNTPNMIFVQNDVLSNDIYNSLVNTPSNKGIVESIRESCIIEIYTFISLFLCALGAILSLLWVMMAKGSKFVYEAYEDAIDKESERFTAKKDSNNTFETKTKKSTFLKNAYVNLDEYEKHTNIPNLFDLGRCRYSVSKINIFLGWLSCLIFVILSIIHSVVYLNYCCFFIVGYIIFFILVFLVIPLFLKGGKE